MDDMFVLTSCHDNYTESLCVASESWCLGLISKIAHVKEDVSDSVTGAS